MANGSGLGSRLTAGASRVDIKGPLQQNTNHKVTALLFFKIIHMAGLINHFLSKLKVLNVIVPLRKDDAICGRRAPADHGWFVENQHQARATGGLNRVQRRHQPPRQHVKTDPQAGDSVLVLSMKQKQTRESGILVSAVELHDPLLHLLLIWQEFVCSQKVPVCHIVIVTHFRCKNEKKNSTFIICIFITLYNFNQ